MSVTPLNGDVGAVFTARICIMQTQQRWAAAAAAGHSIRHHASRRSTAKQDWRRWVSCKRIGLTHNFIKEITKKYQFVQSMQKSTKRILLSVEASTCSLNSRLRKIFYAANGTLRLINWQLRIFEIFTDDWKVDFKKALSFSSCSLRETNLPVFPDN